MTSDEAMRLRPYISKGKKLLTRRYESYYQTVPCFYDCKFWPKVTWMYVDRMLTRHLSIGKPLPKFLLERLGMEIVTLSSGYPAVVLSELRTLRG